MRSAVYTFAAWVVSSMLAGGQQPGPGTTPSPIQITETGMTGSALEFTLHNASSKAISGYVFVIAYHRPDGAMSMERVISSLRGLTTAPNKTYAAGETWSERSQGALLGNGQPLLRRISVDYVLFADESEWGPDVKKGSLKLKGISEGWRAAHAHLARVLQEKGAQAVVTELSRSR